MYNIYLRTRNQDKYIKKYLNPKLTCDRYPISINNFFIFPFNIYLKVHYKLHTCADVTVISVNLLHTLINNINLKRSKKYFTGINKNYLITIGYTEVNITNKTIAVKVSIYFVEHIFEPLLGRPAIEALQLIKRVYRIEAVDVSEVTKFPELFKRRIGKHQGGIFH